MALDAGDIVWVELAETQGTEQFGRRPGLILTNVDYHALSARIILCPVTSTDRKWPFDVAVLAGMRTRGFVMVDQVRAVDRRRVFRIIERAPELLLNQVLAILGPLLGIEMAPVPTIAPIAERR